MPVVRQRLAEQVEPNRIFHVGGVEIYHVLNAMTRYEVEQFRGEIAVRVNDADAIAGTDVLQDQIAQERRFSSAAFADGVKMMAAVVTRQNKRPVLPPYFSHP